MNFWNRLESIWKRWMGFKDVDSINKPALIDRQLAEELNKSLGVGYNRPKDSPPLKVQPLPWAEGFNRRGCEREGIDYETEKTPDFLSVPPGKTNQYPQ